MVMKTYEDGSTKKCIVEWEVRKVGDWNHRGKGQYTLTKPLCFIMIDGDKFIFEHNELKRIFFGLGDADFEAARMIENKNIDTGDVKWAENLLSDKVRKWIDEWEKERYKRNEGLGFHKWSIPTLKK